VAAKGNAAQGFRHVQALPRLEPLTAAIYQRNQRDIGRVRMWRGSLRLGLSVGRPFRLAVP
jgi:hypothetical protein